MSSVWNFCHQNVDISPGEDIPRRDGQSDRGQDWEISELYSWQGFSLLHVPFSDYF